MNYNVKIHVPCNQNWEEMISVNGGKYCVHCSKRVTDFTHLGDQEVIKILQHSPPNLCGRFTNEQLNKEFIADTQKSNHWLSKTAASILFLLAAKNTTADSQKSQRFPIEATRNVYSKPPVNKKERRLNTPPLKISGHLKNKDSVSVSRMRVMIDQTMISTVSDLDGYFELLVPDTIKGSVNIYFSGIGYIAKHVTIQTENLPLDLGEIFMLRSDNYDISSISSMVGGVIASTSKGVNRKWWQFWKRKDRSRNE